MPCPKSEVCVNFFLRTPVCERWELIHLCQAMDIQAAQIVRATERDFIGEGT
jgi:hypothetical protein